MATSTITNTVKDATGTAIAGARVVARLVPAPAFRIVEGTEIAAATETVTDSLGAWSLALERTSNITPANSNYEITEFLPDGQRRHTIQVGASNATLQASLVTPPPAADGNTYLTQASADARYTSLGITLGAVSPSDVGTTASSGASSSAARADHVHDIGSAAINGTGLFAASLVPPQICTSSTRPGSPAEGWLIYETDTDAVLFYDGSAWKRVSHIPHAETVRRVIASNQSLTNPATYAVTPNATDRAALQKSFTKYRADTKLVLEVHATVYQSSGVAQNVFVGITPDGNTTKWDVGQLFFNANNDHKTISGVSTQSGVGAGTYTMEPIWKSSGASVINWDASNDQVSFTVRETL